MRAELRIGMVGTGFIADFHLQALQSVRRARVAAVTSPHADRRLAFAARVDAAGLGPCRAVGSVEEMLAGDLVDAVWLLGPNDTRLEHVAAIERAVSAGARLAGVACEKPLGRTVAEAAEMLALVEHAGLGHAYLENQVFAPAVRRGKEILWRRAAATTGRPYLARASEEHSGPHRPWFWQGERQGGGVLLDMMCHSVEVARFLLTEPGAPRGSLRPVAATGTTASLKWSRPEYAARLAERMGAEVDYRARPAEDVAHGEVRFEDDRGATALVEASTSWAYVGPGLRIGIEVLGPEYSMQIDTLRTGLQLFLSREVVGSAGEDLVEKQNAEQGLMPVLEDEAAAYGYVGEDRHVVDAFAAGRRPAETFEDGLAVTRLLMALYRSAELGRTVDPADPGLDDYVPPVARPGAPGG
ncbi:MAG: Gfo/Idh/MocA family protein [Acidimicrobiales bacterium]